jgi:hypothetical protein
LRVVSRGTKAELFIADERVGDDVRGLGGVELDLRRCRSPSGMASEGEKGMNESDVDGGEEERLG